MRAADHLPARWNAAEHFVGRPAEEHGDALALVTDSGTTSYVELDVRVRRAAAALRAAGIRGGDRVALILPDTPLLSELFWGALAAGAVAVPINPLLATHDKRAIIGDCDARLVVTDDAGMGGGECGAWSADDAQTRVGEAAPAPGYAPTHRDGFAFFLYSSGTTGEPKGVVHLHHDMWICARTYGEEVLRVTREDRCFSVAKLPFAYGLGNAQYFPFHAGASAVLLAGRPLPEVVFDQVRRHRPTLFFGVPTSYGQLIAAMDAGAAADFSSVRACVSAGEALPATLFERWRAHTGLEILDGIGSTEVCHIFLSARPGQCRPGSTGIPVEGYDLKLVDENGQDVARGQIGDLLVRGDSTMALYWNKHEATKSTLAGEWIRTGDKYWVDEDGYYFHAGRSDDMLKCGGHWVSPVEVEGAMVAHPAVLECAVVGAMDEDGLTKPHAVIALRPGTSTTGIEAELIAAARERLPPFKTPRWVTVIPELPKTVTGKIQRFRLRGLPVR